MLQDPQEIVKIWTEELTKASTAIVSESLSGKRLEKTAIEVTIHVPNPLLSAVITASEKTGADPDVVLSQMANEGLHASIRERINQGKNPLPPTQHTAPTIPQGMPDTSQLFSTLKGLGLDMSGLENKMNEIANLASVFEGMKEKVENATAGFDKPQGQNTKNP